MIVSSFYISLLFHSCFLISLMPIFDYIEYYLMQSEVVTVFVVEHMQPYLFQWCLSQYKAMKQYLSSTPARLLITNAQSFYQYDGQHKQQNEKYVAELEQCFAEDQQKYQLQRQSLQQMASELQGRVCMLDMRGKEELSPGEKCNYIVFGGVLGDHPPRDRPAPLRKHFVEIRHLGPMQLATDTAVLVSRLILHNKIQLRDIPMVQAPTIRGLNKKGEKTTVQMEGFSYVSKELDIETGQMLEGLGKKEKKEIYMSEGVRDLLLREDLDQQLLM